MLAAQKEWVLDPFLNHDPNWVMSLVQFGETLGEKCFALLEGKEGTHERTYLSFGEGWILSRQTFDPSETPDPDPLIHLRKFREANFPGMDLESGIIGFLDYEWGLHWQKPKASLATPHYFFRLCPINIVLLPLSKKVILEVFSEEEAHLQQVFNSWTRELNQFFTKRPTFPLSNPLNLHDVIYKPSSLQKFPPSSTSQELNPQPSHPKWQPNMSREDFLSRVERINEYIRAGDIFQAVLSQRFTLNLRIEPWSIYQKLRVLNPSPWLFCVFGEEETLVGSSPELLISSSGSQIKTRPIAGTRPRGKTFTDDQLKQKELLEDPKEMAEHAMLVDLGRNDIGRVSEYGSVKVSEYAGVQYFSHVMHIVSTVEGKLGTPYDSLDALRAVFPAGTLSGAPKVRAMEILQDSEPNLRGAYGGALGIFRWNGDLDFCITIRTLSIKENEVSVQSGAGIVFDSVPEREYEETIHKAKALFNVVDSDQS